MKQFEFFVSRIGSDQLHITAATNGDGCPAAEAAENIYRELAAVLDSNSMQILHERVFGSLEFHESFTCIRQKYFDFAQEPFSYIQGGPCRGELFAGVQVHAIKPASGNDHWVIRDNDRPCGRGWRHNDATYINLAGIAGWESGVGGREVQASLMFEKINQLLASQSARFCDVARIWVYLEDILEWYDGFNSIRTEKFRDFGLMPQSVAESEIEHLYLPASTGVGGRNRAGAASIADVLAIAGDIRVSVLPGVRQRSAYRYGSAFSRGVCVQDRDYDQIFVSGTAAIDQQGSSLHSNDVEAQITRTLETVESLIGEKGAKFENIRSATVYLKRPEDLDKYRRIAAGFGMTRMPAICIVADLCRDELLFEMDAMAAVRRH